MRSPPSFFAELKGQLQSLAGVCDELLALAGRESQALSTTAEFTAFESVHGRKSLLSRLERVLISLHPLRHSWLELDPGERTQNSEVNSLLQAVQERIVRVLALDRENQQALLQRGLVPARHVQSFSAPSAQQAARLYRRHSLAGNAHPPGGFSGPAI